MKKRQRLVRRGDFQQVLESERVFVGRAVVAYARRQGGGARQWRIGVAVSRGVRGAVARNRARRRLREAWRVAGGGGSAAADSGIGYDVVLIARPPALSVPFPDLVAQAALVQGRLAAT